MERFQQMVAGRTRPVVLLWALLALNISVALCLFGSGLYMGRKARAIAVQPDEVRTYEEAVGQSGVDKV